MLLSGTVLSGDSTRFESFFYLITGCYTANFGSLSKEQPHSSDVYYCVLLSFFYLKFNLDLVTRLRR